VARIIVSGYMIRYPVPGNLLAFLPYLVGLRRLGHQVLYLEESGWAGSCYDPSTRRWGDDPAAGLQIVRALLAAAEQRQVAVGYVDSIAGVVSGTSWGALKEALGAADLLLNVGGVCWLPEFMCCRRRALIDMDPMFTQAGKFGGVLAHYHRHFSYGTRIGRPGCTVPTAGIDWLPTVPPVLLDSWTDDGGGGGGTTFTTIGHWDAYGALEWQGERFGQKGEEFLRLLDLPRTTDQPLELAVSGIPAEAAQQLRAAGWSLRDPGDGINASANAYRAYITRSRGELSVAKNAYVKTRCGWFSDRTACYLAAGRPAVVQDTGFSLDLPLGQGLLAFQDLEQARNALALVNRDYDRHRAAACQIARAHFDHRLVLSALLQRALGPGGR
jgi:hypothetical protein